MKAGVVQAVLGCVEPDELGLTQMHEHILVDFVGNRQSDAVTKQDRQRWDEPIRLSNYYDIRRYKRFYRENRILSNTGDAIDEVARFKAAGGSCIVEVTSGGLGRDPAALQEVSRATGVHIVMGSGYYVHDYHPAEVASMSVEEIRDEIVGDLVQGISENGPRAGIIGEIGLSWPTHPDEEKVLRAAAHAQRITGAALTVHPGRHREAPAEAARVIQEAGGDLGRVIIGHLERTVTELGRLVELAETSCYLEFDLFGQESSYYDLAPIDMPNDATRIDLLMALGERGYWNQLLISQDICLKAHLRKYGGEGYAHILANVRPMMLRKGLTQGQINDLLIGNPAKALTMV
jgi:phosphotriesterase-related protein